MLAFVRSSGEPIPDVEDAIGSELSRQGWAWTRDDHDVEEPELIIIYHLRASPSGGRFDQLVLSAYSTLADGREIVWEGSVPIHDGGFNQSRPFIDRVDGGSLALELRRLLDEVAIASPGLKGESMVVAPEPAFSPASLPKKVARQVFVAYSYRLYPEADYRRVYGSLAKAFNARFVFADEKITNLHILEKIQGYIRESQFGIYDISGWNPNVTLELGLALGLDELAYIAIDPSKTPVDEVPSDLRGIDRIQYASYTELEERIGTLLGQQMPLPKMHEAENQLDELRQQVFGMVNEDIGLKMADMAKALGVSTALAQIVVRPLVGRGLRTEGQRRGTRYYLDPSSR